jgi:hypothetical protein
MRYLTSENELTRRYKFLKKAVIKSARLQMAELLSRDYHIKEHLQGPGQA